MASTQTPRINRLRGASRHQKVKIAFAVVLAAAASAFAVAKTSTKIQKHTSILTRGQWVQELLTGHPDRIKEALGMSKAVFRRLLCYLQNQCRLRDSRDVSAVLLH
jgi:hypothetical protein